MFPQDTQQGLASTISPPTRQVFGFARARPFFATGAAILFAYPPEVRTIIYTTNAIESLQMRLRKIVKNRGHFPSDDAASKLLFLALRNIEKDWKMAPRTWKLAAISSPSCSANASRTRLLNYEILAPHTEFVTGPVSWLDSRVRRDQLICNCLAGQYLLKKPFTPADTPTPDLERLNRNGPTLTLFRR